MRGNSNSHLQSSIDELRTQISAAAAQLKVVAKEAADAAARKTSDAAGSKLNSATEEAMGLKDKIVEEAADMASAAYEAAAKEAASGYRKAGSFVGRNPATMLASAFALGLVLGLINRR